MAVFLGVCVALCFGSGDFLGGFASRRSPTLVVLLIAQTCALVGAVFYALVFSADLTGHDLLLGAGAGALNVTALGMLFQGLSTGRMSIVAPVTSVVAASLPVAWGIGGGERPGALALVGVACAVVAAALIARAPDEAVAGRLTRELMLAVLAGIGFGLSFILYASTSDDSGFWPVLAARVVAVPLVGVAVLLTRTKVRIAPVDRRCAIGSGALDVSATALLLVAVRQGLASLVAPLAALGPAFTVAWARGVLKEPLGRLQLAGLGLALFGLALIAIG